MRLFLTALAFSLAPSGAASAETLVPDCAEGSCKVSMTATQLLATAERLVSEHRFGEAAPMLAALKHAPEYDLQRQFLLGYALVESGDLAGGIKAFRSILDKNPEQTRVRLELARALMLKGRSGSADHHFRLAQGDTSIPPEIAATIRTNRRLLRDDQRFSFGLDLGLAPDSNITNGTSAESVDIAFGNQLVPLTLDGNARERSGVGQTLGFSGSAKLRIKGDTRLLVDADSQVVNYSGKDADDIFVQLAIGPEFRLADETRLSLQALGVQRWYGGEQAVLGGGVRANLLQGLGDKARLGFTLDGRHNKSGIANAYTGWQVGGTATFEQVLAKALIASVSLFARRDDLNSAAYAAKEYGFNLGIGGELPFGLNAGLSAGASRAKFDAPLLLFSADPRREWRLNARAQLGIRSLRLLGFSPSLTYGFSQAKSSLTLYDNTRHRLRFGLARYF